MYPFSLRKIANTAHFEGIPEVPLAEFQFVHYTDLE